MTSPLIWRFLCATTIALVMAIGTPLAAAKSRADCEKDFSPKRGQSGKDVIWWPTDDGLVSRMLKMAKVTSSDTLYDLGAGDGRIAITAARQFGARAIGIEFDAALVRFGQCLADVAGVADRVELRQGDIFQSDFSDATVITLYLLQELNLRLRPTLLDMKPGIRVLSHDFTMGEWEPDDRVEAEFGEAYLWIVPAKVAGTWTFHDEAAGGTFTTDLEQTFQRIQGTAAGARLTRATLRGNHIELTFPEGGGATRVIGKVEGDRIDAKVTRNGRTLAYVGTRSQR
jgi:hypothetical protein